MKTDITRALVAEHRLILRMITLLELNAPLTAAGHYTNWQFYLDGVDFIRNYADRFHHAKEEDVLFEALITNGMPRENSPIAAMLMEHDQGRAHVKAMETAAQEALAGQSGRGAIIAEHALAYAALLREHIDKEDTILYPLAERVIPDTMRPGIVEGYASAETKAPADFTLRYEAIVAGYEQEARESA
ncbi:hemerythrin domain-containing protein [Geobacter sp. SVR]|uniref:hemerythrin domain-containing protein n=1 Tax=Geobacter sp. SVR TaxID=2495594 RepID=UPI00143EFAB9|nr:hemerythrin domain-containing protein [Geobacter sp. SVR]BCS54473.1 cation-binding protein [Geobacter sp. SVR]GCF87072.1 cation-binding protein [Geobacter sp. SVR]